MCRPFGNPRYRKPKSNESEQFQVVFTCTRGHNVHIRRVFSTLLGDGLGPCSGISSYQGLSELANQGVIDYSLDNCSLYLVVDFAVTPHAWINLVTGSAS